MKNTGLILLGLIISCTEHGTAHPPVGGTLSQKDLNISKNRARSLNMAERSQIENWIDGQDQQFFPMNLNYWASDKKMTENPRLADGTMVSYRYDIYDFDEVRLYEDSRGQNNAVLGHFEEIKAVEDALRHMQSGDNVTLLVPSVLAFGTYGDNDKISNDMPLIIKLSKL